MACANAILAPRARTNDGVIIAVLDENAVLYGNDEKGGLCWLERNGVKSGWQGL